MTDAPIAVTVGLGTGEAQGHLEQLGMTELIAVFGARSGLVQAGPGCELTITVKFPSGRTLHIQGKLLEKQPLQEDSVRVRFELAAFVDSSKVRPTPERRVKGRISLRNSLKPVCVAQHPFLPELTMAFKVQDINSTGMRLACIDSYPALVPGMVFDGDLFLSQSGKPIPGRFVVCRVQQGTEVMPHTLGVAFVEPSRRLLDTIARHLLTEERASPDQLFGAGLFRTAKALGHGSAHAISEACTDQVTDSQTGESSVATVRVVQTLDEWIQVLKLRMDTREAPQLVESHGDVRFVQEPADALATHHACWTETGLLIGAMSLLPVSHQTARAAEFLRSTLRLDAGELNLLELSRISVHPHYPVPKVLDLLLEHAAEYSRTYNLGDILVQTSGTWLGNLQKCRSAPSRIVKVPDAERGTSLLLFRVGREGRKTGGTRKAS